MKLYNRNQFCQLNESIGTLKHYLKWTDTPYHESDLRFYLSRFDVSDKEKENIKKYIRDNKDQIHIRSNGSSAPNSVTKFTNII